MHFASQLHVLFKESQGAEQGAVVLQDLNVIRHIAVHLKVLLGLHVRKRIALFTQNVKLFNQIRILSFSHHTWFYCFAIKKKILCLYLQLFSSYIYFNSHLSSK